MIIAEEVDSLNDTPSNCDEEFLDSLEPTVFTKKCRVTVDVNVGLQVRAYLLFFQDCFCF